MYIILRLFLEKCKALALFFFKKADHFLLKFIFEGSRIGFFPDRRIEIAPQ